MITKQSDKLSDTEIQSFNFNYLVWHHRQSATELVFKWNELQLELRHVSLEIILQENYAAMLMKTLMLTLSRCKKQELVWFLIYFTLSICTILSTLLVVGSRLVGSADPGDPVPLVVAVPLTTLPAVTDDAAPVAGPVAILLVGTARLLSPSHVLVTGKY